VHSFHPVLSNPEGIHSMFDTDSRNRILAVGNIEPGLLGAYRWQLPQTRRQPRRLSLLFAWWQPFQLVAFVVSQWLQNCVSSY
jgi:hypothetical protein